MRAGRDYSAIEAAKAKAKKHAAELEAVNEGRKTTCLNCANLDEELDGNFCPARCFDFSMSGIEAYIEHRKGCKLFKLQTRFDKSQRNWSGIRG